MGSRKLHARVIDLAAATREAVRRLELFVTAHHGSLEALAAGSPSARARQAAEEMRAAGRDAVNGVESLLEQQLELLSAVTAAVDGDPPAGVPLRKGDRRTDGPRANCG